MEKICLVERKVFLVEVYGGGGVVWGGCLFLCFFGCLFLLILTLDIQGHLLRYGMTGPDKNHTQNTGNTSGGKIA